MLFQLYGETAGYQLLGFVLVFTGLVLANEFAAPRPVVSSASWRCLLC